jgi:hypothetical protein
MLQLSHFAILTQKVPVAPLAETICRPVPGGQHVVDTESVDAVARTDGVVEGPLDTSVGAGTVNSFQQE